MDYHWLLDDLALGVVSLDGMGRVQYANAAARAMLGQDGAGGPPDDALLRQMPESWRTPVDEALRTGEPRGLPLVRVNSDGAPRSIEGEARPAPEGGGAALVIRDVTTQQADEAELRLRDRAISASTTGILLTDATRSDNPIIYVNPAFCRITGYSAEEALGNNCRFLQRGDRDQPGLDRLREAIRAGSACTVVLRNYRKNGEMFWNELNISPVRDDAGRLTHFVGVQQDISDRKRAQDDLLERNQELQAARDELATRNAELREATQAKNRFLATMSHEMRTPLNAILGYVELLNLGVAGNLTDRQQSHIGRIAHSGRALLDLINDVLDFTRAEAGHLPVELRPIHAAVVAEEAVELIRVAADDKGLSLVLERPEAQMPPVQADFRRLRQILVNLLGNAVKFTDRGEIRVRIHQPSPVEVAVSVSDTGIGIDQESLERIFTEFYQADSELTREYGGAGLGLAISQQLARLMGASIEVQSERGVGSTFTLRLATAASQTEPQETDRSAAAAGQPAAAEPATAVVVFGDDTATLNGLRQQLEPHVRVVATMAHTNVAELARQERAALVVLDVACQDGAGWEAAHEVREDPALDDVAMLLLPCLPAPAPDGGVGALDLGWVAVVPKPFAPDQLARVVSSAAGRALVQSGERSLDVLVVDDDADAREIASRILGAAGAQVRYAPDGESGLAEMRRAAPDVAVLDLMMPVLDGFGVLAAMRADPALRDIPVVVLTAKDLSEAERRFLSRTAETVLQKGVHSLADVAELVRRAAARQGTGAEGTVGMQA